MREIRAPWDTPEFREKTRRIQESLKTETDSHLNELETIFREERDFYRSNMVALEKHRRRKHTPRIRRPRVLKKKPNPHPCFTCGDFDHKCLKHYPCKKVEEWESIISVGMGKVDE